jgi:pumilio RNA-binding family
MMMQQMQMCGQMIPSGCMTPVPMMPSGCMTPVPMMPPAQHKCGLQETSNLSTALPSGACSDAGSEVDENEDSAEACAELIEQLEAGGEAREAAIEAISGSVVDLAFDAGACRVVQKAFETADVDTAGQLAQELQGHIREAITCPHANHVLQKMLDALPADKTAFIVGEVLGAAVELSKHRFGCRVMSRAVKVHASAFSCPEIETLIDELLPEVGELSRHTFAHYVVEAILDAGSTDHTHEVACALRMDLMRNGKNRSATYVVEKALFCCDAHDQEALAAELFGSAASLLELTENQFGCHLAKALPRLEEHFRRAQKYLPEATPLLQKTKYGRRVLQEFSQHMQ